MPLNRGEISGYIRDTSGSFDKSKVLPPVKRKEARLTASLAWQNNSTAITVLKNPQHCKGLITPNDDVLLMFWSGHLTQI